MFGKKLVPLAFVAAFGLASGACDNGLTDINKNPNAPTDVGAQFLLPQAIRSAVETTFGGTMLSHTMIWPQHGVEIQYPEEEQGNVRPGTMQSVWDSYYAGSLQDIQTVIDKGQETGEPNVEAVGMIWKTYIFHLATDLWGDIPYSQALKADEGVTAPVYDTQEEVYAGMIQTLQDAAAMLDAGADGFGSGDILYSNDFEKWRRFANSMRLRLAMRMSEADPAAAQSAFVSAYNDGVFQSNSDNAMLRWPGAPYANPIFENWQGRDDHGISATMVDTLASLQDPRLELYAEPSAQDGKYRGLENGVANPPLSIAWYSRIGNFWRRDGASTPTALITYSEVLFLEAEAAQLGWIADDPATLYENGIRANMNQWDAQSPANAPTDAEINTYLARPEIQFDASRGRTQIQLQEWIGLFMNGNEAWSNWRRTGVPHLSMGPDLTLSRIPVRFSYPDLEQSLNKANLNEAVSRQGGGLDLVTPVWWQGN
jgi:Starch-binding associating with outer membrane